MRRIVTENGVDGKSRVMQIAEVVPGGVIWESSSDDPLGREPRDAPALDFLAGGLKAFNLSLPTDADMREYLKAGLAGHDSNGFHRTGTLDFLILLDGELSLELEDETVRLEPGDVVVQRDTNHAWRNTGDKPARCFAVIHTPPFTDGSE